MVGTVLLGATLMFALYSMFGQSPISPVTTTAPAPQSLQDAPIPDTKDLLNEINRVGQAQQLAEERLRSSNEKIDFVRTSLFALTGFLTAVIAIAAWFQRSSMEKLFDRTIQTAEERINSKAEKVLAEIEKRYDEPDAIENRIVGRIHADFEVPGKIRRDAVGEILDLMEDGGVITQQQADAMRRTYRTRK
jgi:hypothetical protein